MLNAPSTGPDLYTYVCACGATLQYLTPPTYNINYYVFSLRTYVGDETASVTGPLFPSPTSTYL